MWCPGDAAGDKRLLVFTSAFLWERKAAAKGSTDEAEKGRVLTGSGAKTSTDLCSYPAPADLRVQERKTEEAERKEGEGIRLVLVEEAGRTGEEEEKKMKNRLIICFNLEQTSETL